MGERELDMAMTAFSATPDGTLEFDSGKAKNLDKNFGQIVLEEKFVKGKTIRDMNRNPGDNQITK